MSFGVMRWWREVPRVSLMETVIFLGLEKGSGRGFGWFERDVELEFAYAYRGLG